MTGSRSWGERSKCGSFHPSTRPLQRNRRTRARRRRRTPRRGLRFSRRRHGGGGSVRLRLSGGGDAPRRHGYGTSLDERHPGVPRCRLRWSGGSRRCGIPLPARFRCRQAPRHRRRAVALAPGCPRGARNTGAPRVLRERPRTRHRQRRRRLRASARRAGRPRVLCGVDGAPRVRRWRSSPTGAGVRPRATGRRPRRTRSARGAGTGRTRWGSISRRATGRRRTRRS